MKPIKIESPYLFSFCFKRQMTWEILNPRYVGPFKTQGDIKKFYSWLCR